MNDSIKKLLQKYQDMIPYTIFGLLGTALNFGVYWVSAHGFHMGTMPSTVLAWACAVIFAYITNHKWVFHSAAHTPKTITKELLSFVTCRLITGAVDLACMYVFVTRLHWNDSLVKLAASMLNVSINYFASRSMIFKSET